MGNKWYKWTYFQNKNKSHRCKNKLMITSGEKDKWEVWDWHIHTTINKWIINKDLLHSTENYSALCNDLYEKKIGKKSVNSSEIYSNVFSYQHNWSTFWRRNYFNVKWKIMIICLPVQRRCHFLRWVGSFASLAGVSVFWFEFFLSPDVFLWSLFFQSLLLGF